MTGKIRQHATQRPALRAGPALHAGVRVTVDVGHARDVQSHRRDAGYLGRIYDWLDAIGDGTNGVPELISGLVVAGCLWIPILAYLFRIGLSASAHVINLIGLAFSICVCIPTVTAQVFGAIIYAAYRAAFYASVPNFCAGLFGQKSRSGGPRGSYTRWVASRRY